jgi:hypothetical protein
MKKLILSITLFLATLGVQAQNVYYKSIVSRAITWDSIRIPVVDTTVIITGSGIIAQYNATLTFKMTGLDSSVIVHPGGSSSMLSATMYDFHPFMNDSFPYPISRLKWVRTVNGVTQNEKSFTITQPIGYIFLSFYLKNSGTTPTSKYLKYNVLYTKP